jgi:hypothetical protein
MESKVAREKIIVDDLIYKTAYSNKNGSDIKWEYKCSRKIQSYKPEDLLKTPISDYSHQFADEVCNNIKSELSDAIDVTSQQEVFYRDCTHLLLNDLNINSPVLIPVKCGFGKSSFIKSYISTIIGEVKNRNCEFSNLPMIIATDRVNDLKSIKVAIEKKWGYYHAECVFGDIEHDEPDYAVPYVYVMESWNKDIECPRPLKDYKESLEICNPEGCDNYSRCKLAVQNDEQKFSPIVAITNKRLAVLLDEEDASKGIDTIKKFVDKNGREHTRNILIIDEKPSIVDPKEISISTITDIITEIDERTAINDEEKMDKHFMEADANRIKIIFDHIKQEFSNQKTSFVYPNEVGFSGEFIEKWHKHFRMRKISDIAAINDFLAFGGLFLNNTEHEYFLTTRRNRFNINGLKTFVFDGTAELSMEYSGQETDFAFLNIDDYKNFNNLTFKIVDENYSKSAIAEKVPNEASKSFKNMNNSLVEVMCKWINNNLTEDTFVVSYKSVRKGRDKVLVNEIMTKLLKSNPYIRFDKKDGEKIIPYFGFTKGKNLWAQCAVMVQAGWNRYQPEDYYSRFFTTNEQIKKRIIEKYEDIKHKQDVIFNTDSYGQFVLDDLELYRLFSMAVDLEQEIYRTSIRNFGETDKPVTVYLFKASDALREILKQRFKGCHIENVPTQWEFSEYKKLNRKGNEHVKKLFEWIDNEFLVKGSPMDGSKKISISYIKKHLNISHQQWSYIISNQEYEDLLKRRRVKQSKQSGKKYLIKY